MDYSKFTVEDFASDDRFIQWANRTNPEAERFWDDFVAAHPEMAMKIAQARTLVLNLRRAEALHHAEDQIDSLWQSIEHRIGHSAETTLPVKRQKRFSLGYAMAAVLVISCTASAGWYLFETISTFNAEPDYALTQSGSDYVEEVNTSGNILKVHLSDGTTVELENNSRLKYKKNFSGEPSRAVYLTGEAFFEVTKDPVRPFLVHTGEVVTRVLGTSFRVSALEEDADVIVSVKTGKVSVYSIGTEDAGADSSPNAVVLLPNQQVTYLRDQNSFGKALVAEPQIVVPGLDQADFTFENTPIREVFSVLGEAYGIEIIFDEEIMSDCYITAPLRSEPLFEKLRVICRTIGARFETIDAKVVITSAGC